MVAPTSSAGTRPVGSSFTRAENSPSGPLIPGNYSSIDTLAGLGDYNRDGRADLVMRTTKGKGYVLPSRGNGTFGHLIGPLKSLKGLTGITGGGQITGFRTPDLVARSGDKLVVVRSRGTFHTGKSDRDRHSTSPPPTSS